MSVQQRAGEVVSAAINDACWSLISVLCPPSDAISFAPRLLQHCMLELAVGGTRSPRKALSADIFTAAQAAEAIAQEVESARRSGHRLVPTRDQTFCALPLRDAVPHCEHSGAPPEFRCIQLRAHVCVTSSPCPLTALHFHRRCRQPAAQCNCAAAQCVICAAKHR